MVNGHITSLVTSYHWSYGILLVIAYHCLYHITGYTISLVISDHWSHQNTDQHITGQWSYHITGLVILHLTTGHIMSLMKVVTVGGQSGAISPVGALSPGGEEVASGVGVSQEASFIFLGFK